MKRKRSTESTRVESDFTVFDKGEDEENAKTPSTPQYRLTDSGYSSLDTTPEDISCGRESPPKRTREDHSKIQAKRQQGYTFTAEEQAVSRKEEEPGWWLGAGTSPRPLVLNDDDLPGYFNDLLTSEQTLAMMATIEGMDVDEGIGEMRRFLSVLFSAKFTNPLLIRTCII
jgi:hypothetical protein